MNKTRRLCVGTLALLILILPGAILPNGVLRGVSLVNHF